MWQKAGLMQPLQWWATYGGGAPALQSVATRALGVIVNTSACERIWSDFDFVASKRRQKLSADKQRALVSSRSWLQSRVATVRFTPFTPAASASAAAGDGADDGDDAVELPPLADDASAVE